MAKNVTLLLRLSLEEARAYWGIADEILGRAKPYKEALAEEGEETIDAAERAHDRLRQELERLEGDDD